MVVQLVEKDTNDSPVVLNPTKGYTKAQWQALALVSLATLTMICPWFSVNAVSSSLLHSKFSSNSPPGEGPDEGAYTALLTVMVQLGFVTGAVLLAVTNITDALPTRSVILASALLVALCNALVVPVKNRGGLLALRFVVGLGLGGAYPPSMKVLSGWFRHGRGFALGCVVGALTLGSGVPHLIRAITLISSTASETSAQTDEWEPVVWSSSSLAALGGLCMQGLVRDGPFEASGPAPPLQPQALLQFITDAGLRYSLLGYLGHMVELYAFWTYMPAFLLERLSSQVSPAGVYGIAFAVFASGALMCPVAGHVAESKGRTWVAILSMAISGFCALWLGFVPGDTVATAALLIAGCLVYGASIIPDSAQFSACITELADPQQRGTLLTFGTGIGFALTAAAIYIVSLLQPAAGWGAAFAVLAIGPVMGIVSMLKLRQIPSAVQKLAGGNG